MQKEKISRDWCLTGHSISGGLVFVLARVTAEVATVKQVWLLVFVLVSFNSLSSQEVKHAPTVEQCRADQRLWHDKVEFRESELPDYDTLSNWELELWDCTTVDRDNRSPTSRRRI